MEYADNSWTFYPTLDLSVVAAAHEFDSSLPGIA